VDTAAARYARIRTSVKDLYAVQEALSKAEVWARP
jgi:hypothetical protein